MNDTPVGAIELSASSRLVFTVGRWKGRQLAHVRKHVASSRYTGPTPSGLAMAGNIAVALAAVLERLKVEVPGAEPLVFARLPKSGNNELVVAVIPPDDLKALPSVDIREYIDSPNYKGPTKKGVRFPWDKLSEFKTLLESQGRLMGTNEAAEPTLFPDAHAAWVEDATTPSAKPVCDVILSELLPEGPKDFPADFMNATLEASVVELPTEPIFAFQLSNGAYVVKSDFGFNYAVRNPTEGNFVIYARLRGHRQIQVPTQMIEIFRAVKAYENYLREVRHALMQAYERKSGHRPMAEHQTREVFTRLGLPWL